MRILKDWCFSCSFNRERLIGTYIVLLKTKGKIKVLNVLVQKEAITYSFFVEALAFLGTKMSPGPKACLSRWSSFSQGRICQFPGSMKLQLSNATKRAKFHTLISIHRVFGPPATVKVYIKKYVVLVCSTAKWQDMKWWIEIRTWDDMSLVTSKAIMCI